MRTRILHLSAFLFLVLSPSLSFAGFPTTQGRVSDFAGVLGQVARAHLLQTIHQVESKTSAEIAVVTVSSLDGLTVEDYAVQLFKKWGIGKKKKDNGLLVLVCPPEHKARIEVGYGLEPTITDGLAGSVIRAYFIPAFKKGDYEGGITAGVDQLAQFLMGIESPQNWTPPDSIPPDTQLGFGEKAGITGFLSLFVLIGFSFLGLGLSTKSSFGLIFGAGFGGMPLLFLFIPDLAGWPRTTVLGEAAAALLLGIWLGIKYPKALKGKTGKGGSGWSSGGFSSGSGSSDSSSSSDDSFGGGSSGGGGASGSW